MIAALRTARRIYIARCAGTERRARQCRVWFTLTDDNSMLIPTERNSWTAQPVRKGSPLMVWIGWRAGPALIGVGEPGNEPALSKQIIDDFQRKYLLARIGFYHSRFARFESGRILPASGGSLGY